jgi:PAS domain S-box-containing protein
MRQPRKIIAGGHGERATKYDKDFYPFHTRCLRWVMFALLVSAIRLWALDPQKAVTQYSHRTWGVAEGIEQANSICQTSDGYLWVATINGLYRFDGVSFQKWEPKPGEPGLPGVPRVVLGTKNGNLWVGGVGYLISLRNGHSKIFILRNPDERAFVSTLCEDAEGTVWAGTSLGLYQFHGATWQKLGMESGLPEGEITALTVDRQNTFWAALNNLKGSTPRMIAFRRQGDASFQTGKGLTLPIFGLAHAKDGKIWAAQTSSSVWAFTYDASGVRAVAPGIHVGSQSVLVDRDGGVWITTLGDGIRRIRDPATLGPEEVGQFSDRVDQYTQKDGLSGDYMTCSFEDREGNIWFGTASGLDCFCENKIIALSVREGLPFDQNLCLQATPDGSIWAGSTPNGLIQIFPGQNIISNRGWLGLLGKVPGSMIIHCLYSDPRGDLVLGTGPGVAIFHQADGVATFLPEVPELQTVIAITRDFDGGLWLCDRNVGVYRLLNGNLQKFPELHRKEDGWVSAAITDRQGRVWLGLTTGEVALYEKGQFKIFSSKDGLFPGQITSIMDDTKGGIWMVGNGGISQYESGHFRTLNRQNGLPFDDIFALLEDNDENFWLAGSGGLFRVAKNELETAMSADFGMVKGQIFDMSDGLRGMIRHSPLGFRGMGNPVATKGTDGKLWFATTTGLVEVDPHHLPRNPLPPLVHLEHLKAGGAAHELLANLELAAGTKDCEFDYAGLSFGSPSGVRFKYKLEGYDLAWVDAGTRRQAFYSNLRPGHYQFRVLGCNADGVWNEAGDTLKFSIRPTFYQTSWFHTLCVGLTLLALAGIYAWRIRHLKTRHEALQKASDLLAGANTSLKAEIEERRRAEGLLRKSEAYLAEAQRLSLTGSFGWNVSTGELVWSEETFCILGYHRVIRPTMELVLDRVHRGDLDFVKRTIANAAQTGSDLDFEHRLSMPHGAVKRVHVVARSGRTEMGHLEYVGAIMDITRQKRLEDELRQSEKNLSEGQRLTKTGSWILDYLTGDTDWSVETCRIFGFPDPPPSPHYREFRTRVRPEDRDGVDRGLLESFTTGEARPLKYVVILPDGTCKHIETISQPVRDESGKVVKLMGTVMDVTQRQQAEDALRASELLASGQLNALTRTLDALASESEPDKFLNHVLRNIVQELQAHSSSVWRRDSATGLMNFEFAYENGKLMAKDNASIGPVNSSLEIQDVWPWPEIFRTGKPSVLLDIRQGPSFPWRKRLLEQGVVTILTVPMLIAGKVEGVIGIRFASHRMFGAGELALAQAFANQAMLALQLTRLSAQSRETAVIAERNRMARDVHDTLAQGFTGVIMQLEAAKGATTQGDFPEATNRIERAGELARSSLGEARRSVRALRPRSLRNGRLFTTLDDLLKRMTEGTDLNAEFRAEGVERAIPSEYEDGLLRITQESLTNAVKHASARNFKATLNVSAEKIQLQLVDDGRGFDPHAEHEGFGLMGMKERVEQMNGEFLIRAKPGVGTEILVMLKINWR